MKITLLTALLSLPILYPAKSYVFNLNVKEGEKLELSRTLHQEITQNVMGAESKTHLDMTSTEELLFKQVSADELILEKRFKSYSLTGSNPASGMTETHSTDDKNASKKFKELLNATVTYTVDANSYEVVKVDGLKEVKKAISDAGMLGGKLADNITEEFEKEEMGKLFLGLKKDGFSEDMSWQVEGTRENKKSGVTTYTVEDVSKTQLKLNSKNELDFTERRNEMGSEMEISMKGSFTGKVELNEKLGVISSSSLEGSMTGEVLIKANGQMPSDMRIPMVISQSTSLTVK